MVSQHGRAVHGASLLLLEVPLKAVVIIKLWGDAAVCRPEGRFFYLATVCSSRSLLSPSPVFTLQRIFFIF